MSPEDLRRESLAWLALGRRGSATARSQETWFVDPINGKNNNKGTSRDQPIKTKAQIAAHWGGWRSTLTNVNVTVVYMNSDVDGSDPGLFEPELNNSTFHQIADLPAPSFVGKLGAVTPKNYDTNQALQVTFSGAGSIAADMLAINLSKEGSRALVHRNLGGGIWQMAQPLLPRYNPDTYPGTIPQIDSWAAGDDVELYTLLNINLAKVGGLAVNMTGFGNTPGHRVSQMCLWAAGETFDSIQAEASAFTLFDDCVFFRLLAAGGGVSPVFSQSFLINCGHDSGMFVGCPNQDNAWVITGGYSGGGIIKGSTLGGNHIVGESDSFGGVLITQDVSFDNQQVYIDSGCSILAIGICQLAGSIVAPKIYGPGEFNCQGVVTNTHTWLESMKCPISIGHERSTSAFAQRVNANNTVDTFFVPLSAATLDAAAGPTGFGGVALSGGFALRGPG